LRLPGGGRGPRRSARLAGGEDRRPIGARSRPADGAVQLRRTGCGYRAPRKQSDRRAVGQDDLDDGGRAVGGASARGGGTRGRTGVGRDGGRGRVVVAALWL